MSGNISGTGSGSASSWSQVGGGQDGRFFNDGDDLEPLQIAKRTAAEFWTAFESGDGERLRELVAVARELDVATWQLYAFGRDTQGASEAEKDRSVKNIMSAWSSATPVGLVLVTTDVCGASMTPGLEEKFAADVATGDIYAPLGLRRCVATVEGCPSTDAHAPRRNGDVI